MNCIFNPSYACSACTDSALASRLAILDYLQHNNYSATSACFRQEAQLPESPLKEQASSLLLEKKWSSVVRLQRKILDLESKLNNQLFLAPTSSTPLNSLPCSPPSFTLVGHRSPITCIAFHPCQTLIASSSDDSSIKLWDYTTGEYLQTLKSHTKQVTSLAFNSPSGSLLASCSADMSIKLWDPSHAYANTRTLLGHEHCVSAVAFIPSTSSNSSASATKDTATTVSGDILVSVSRDKTVKLWDLSSGWCIKTLLGHTEWVRAISITPNASLMATCSSDQTARIWTMESATSITELRGHDHVVECIRFIPTSSYSLIQQLYNITPVKPLNGSTNATDSFVPTQGKYVVTGSRDKSIRLWDTHTAQCIYTFTGHDNWIRGLEFDPSGKHLLSVSDDKCIKVWCLRTGRCIKTLHDAHDHFVACIVWSPIISVLATGSVDAHIKIWNCK